MNRGEVLFQCKDEKETIIKMYERLGAPDDSWEECKKLGYYEELK